MIAYLSCTGNTRWAAEHLAHSLNECLVSIPDAIAEDHIYNIKKGERVGICFPVHGWKLQPIIIDFIERLQAEGGNKPYVFILLTAGDSCGEVLEQVGERLKAKGWGIDAACSLIMPESYIGLPFMDVDTDLREAEKKMEAHKVLTRFTDDVLYHRTTRLNIVRGYLPRLYSRVIGPFFHRFLIRDDRFHLDASRCTGCGRCVKACPVHNMQMQNALPTWLHNGRCLTCFACYHHCPNHAIDFWHFTRKKGQYFFSHNKQSSLSR